jgi:hypothetical protein
MKEWLLVVTSVDGPRISRSGPFPSFLVINNTNLVSSCEITYLILSVNFIDSCQQSIGGVLMKLTCAMSLTFAAVGADDAAHDVGISCAYHITSMSDC